MGKNIVKKPDPGTQMAWLVAYDAKGNQYFNLEFQV